MLTPLLACSTEIDLDSRLGCQVTKVTKVTK